MQAEPGASIHMEIPFYRQHFDFTYGPTSLMMVIIGLSLPEMIILRKVIKIKLLLTFAGILFVSFTLTGYLFNAILG
jgi:uncharacterized membrane protein YraQ (UPF0718 family)